MKGYLTRIAAGVFEREPRVHPLVGSMFQAANATPDAEFNNASEFRDDEQIVVAPHEISTPLAQAQAASIASAKSNDGAISRTDPPEHANSYVPLIPSAPSDHAAPLRAQIRTTSEPTNVSPAISVPRLMQPEPAPTTSAPLILKGRSMARRDGEPANPQFFQYPMSRLVGTRPADPTRRSVDAHPTPQSPSGRLDNDVQIHIGRIEVIAVPPTPARPAPKPPARQAMSLDEYLRRRERGLR